MTKSYGKIYNDKKNVSITPLDIYNLYPVGSIYISVINTNPSTYFGGTWEVFGTGRCLVGVDTSQTEFNAVLKTGGEKTHKLTVSELASHVHSGLVCDLNVMLYNGGTGIGYSLPFNGNGGYTTPIRTNNEGGNQAHNNLQPYITVYMWRRIS